MSITFYIHTSFKKLCVYKILNKCIGRYTIKWKVKNIVIITFSYPRMVENSGQRFIKINTCFTERNWNKNFKCVLANFSNIHIMGSKITITHSSQFQVLCLIQNSNKMLQNWAYFIYVPTRVRRSKFAF